MTQCVNWKKGKRACDNLTAPPLKLHRQKNLQIQKKSADAPRIITPSQAIVLAKSSFFGIVPPQRRISRPGSAWFDTDSTEAL